MFDLFPRTLRGWLAPIEERVNEHPYAAVMLLALMIRIPAVIWSKGFIHSDDYYDTVMIAYDWLLNGHWGSDGFLRWRTTDSTKIGRFPLYTMFLWAVMKVHWVAGVRGLQEMMYSIRFLHALISLVPVGATYAIVLRVSGDRRWAFWGGMAAAFHFAMPFLGVRNLIEVVGGNVWMAALACVYLYADTKNRAWLVWAGVLTGLAWMVRFQIAFAALPVPFLIWWQTKRFGDGVLYGVGVTAMLILSGVADYALLGRFAGSTLTNLSINVGLPALYNTIPLLYPAILVGMLLPPLGVIVIWAAGRPSFWKRHAVLVGSTAAFVLAHSLVDNQQERFIFPMLSPVLLIGILAVWQKQHDHGYLVKRRWVMRGSVTAALAVNSLLLAFLVTAYGHKGLIEAVLRVRQTKPDALVMYVHPEMRKFMTTEYGDERMVRWTIKSWGDLRHVPSRPVDYVVLYPPDESRLAAYLDSARTVVGPLAVDTVIAPSAYDALLHRLNAGHNPNYRAYIYRAEGARRAGD